MGSLGEERDGANPKALNESKAVPMRPEPSIEAAIQERSLVLMVDDHPINRTVLTQ